MPARARLRRRLSLGAVAALLGVAALSAGCGAAQPQLPVEQANRVASALTGIAEACGEAYQRRVPSSGARAAPAIATAAAMRAAELAKVFAAYPERIYQAQTLRRVVAQSIGYLRECGLDATAEELDRRARPALAAHALAGVQR